MKNLNQEYKFVIVGAGISGTSTALALLEAGHKDMLILESSTTCGGVWRDNTYPGVACDIPSLVYQFPKYKNPSWSKLYADGAEIRDYIADVRRKSGIEELTVYGHSVEGAVYQDKDKCWLVNLDSGHRIKCKYLIKATGAFNSPLIPSIDGINDFKGEIFHTSSWPESYNPAGKRVAVLGTGSSSIQLVPIIAESAQALYVYQRTPIWLLPKLDLKIPRIVRAMLAKVSVLNGALRSVFYPTISYFLQVVLSASGKHPKAHKFAEKIGKWNIRRQLSDDDLVEKFTPRYNLGCKRPSFSNNYYRVFEKENVNLVTDGVKKITETGIINRGGDSEVPFDTIILATGFNILGSASKSLPAFSVVGKHGCNLRNYWHSEDNFKAFRGASVNGFPNLFLNLGIPYAAGTNWFETADIISRHIVKCLDIAEERNYSSIEVNASSVDKYMKEMDDIMKYSIHHVGSCVKSNSYYYDNSGRTPLYSGEKPSKSWEMADLTPETEYTYSD